MKTMEPLFTTLLHRPLLALMGTFSAVLISIVNTVGAFS